MKIIRKIHQNLSGRQASDLDLNFKVIMVTKVTVKLILDFNREKNVYAIWKQLEQFTNNYHSYKFLDSSMSIHQFSKSQKFEKIWINLNSRYFIQFWFWVCYILHLISFFLACLVTEKIVFFLKSLHYFSNGGTIQSPFHVLIELCPHVSRHIYILCDFHQHPANSFGDTDSKQTIRHHY